MQWREMGNKTTNFDLSVGHADVEDLLIGVSSKTVYRQLHSIQWLNCIYDMNSGKISTKTFDINIQCSDYITCYRFMQHNTIDFFMCTNLIIPFQRYQLQK